MGAADAGASSSRGACKSSSKNCASDEEIDYGKNLRISVCCNQGGRKYMEDRVHIYCQKGENGKLDFVYVAVYDGHGGAEASDFAKAHLLNNIMDQRGFYSDSDEDILQAIQEGFLQTHNAMRKVVDQWTRTASGFTSTAGTTASVAFIRNGKLYTGHVGDSAIVLGSAAARGGGCEARQVTIDHKPDSPAELRRIRSHGGEVLCKSGVMRVVWTRPVRGHTGPVRRSTPQEKIPFLAVARALGDLWSYNSTNDQFVVSPEPDVDVIPLRKESRCLILGSDGLWNVIKAQHSVDIVNSHEWKDLNEKHGSGLNAHILDRECHQNHSRWLVKNGLRGWGSLRADNITALTVVFDPPDARLPRHSACVLQHAADHLDLERALTHNTNALVRIGIDSLQVLKTAPVELVYSGALDPLLSENMKIGMHRSFSFSGPGFSLYSFESPRAAGPSRSSSSPGNMAAAAKQTPRFKYTVRGVVNGESELEMPGTPVTPGTARRLAGGLDADEETDDDTDEEEPPPAFKPPPSLFGKKNVFDWSPPSKQKAATKTPVAKATTSPSRRPHGQSATSKKPKYICKKHGLTCEKVKKLNDEFYENKRKSRIVAADAASTSKNEPIVAVAEKMTGKATNAVGKARKNRWSLPAVVANGEPKYYYLRSPPPSGAAGVVTSPKRPGNSNWKQQQAAKKKMKALSTSALRIKATARGKGRRYSVPGGVAVKNGEASKPPEASGNPGETAKSETSSGKQLIRAKLNGVREEPRTSTKAQTKKQQRYSLSDEAAKVNGRRSPDLRPRSALDGANEDSRAGGVGINKCRKADPEADPATGDKPARARVNGVLVNGNVRQRAVFICSARATAEASKMNGPSSIASGSHAKTPSGAIKRKLHAPGASTANPNKEGAQPPISKRTRFWDSVISIFGGQNSADPSAGKHN